jgi:hypothetical protein
MIDRGGIGNSIASNTRGNSAPKAHDTTLAIFKYYNSYHESFFSPEIMKAAVVAMFQVSNELANDAYDYWRKHLRE